MKSKEVMQAVSEIMEIPMDRIVAWGKRQDEAMARSVIVYIMVQAYDFSVDRACQLIDRHGANAAPYFKSVERRIGSRPGFVRQLKRICEKLELNYEEVFSEAN